MRVSLLCSEWEQVVPPRHGHPETGVPYKYPESCIVIMFVTELVRLSLNKPSTY